MSQEADDLAKQLADQYGITIDPTLIEPILGFLPPVYTVDQQVQLTRPWGNLYPKGLIGRIVYATNDGEYHVKFNVEHLNLIMPGSTELVISTTLSVNCDDITLA